MIDTITPILCAIVLLAWLALYIITYLPDFIKKTFKPQKVKKETEFNRLFRSYVALNDNALRAYKAMIQASYNSSQTHRQDVGSSSSSVSKVLTRT